MLKNLGSKGLVHHLPLCDLKQQKFEEEAADNLIFFFKEATLYYTLWSTILATNGLLIV